MQIVFYEEFPTQKNLEKLKLVKLKTKLFVAAKSIKEFKKLEKDIEKINSKIEVAYWPIIKNSYWISPFSNTKDLIELFNELDKINNNILIDLEPPLDKKLVIKNLFSFFKNKKLIKKFLGKNKKRVITAQFLSALTSKFLRFIGLDYNINTEKSLMFYSSMNSEKKNNYAKKILLNLKNKKDCSVSLGVIAHGIHRDEPILSPESLEKDLEFVKNFGFSKVIIFRLGGLNKKYMAVINKFQNKLNKGKLTVKKTSILQKLKLPKFLKEFLVP